MVKRCFGREWNQIIRIFRQFFSLKITLQQTIRLQTILKMRLKNKWFTIKNTEKIGGVYAKRNDEDVKRRQRERHIYMYTHTMYTYT